MGRVHGGHAGFRCESQLRATSGSWPSAGGEPRQLTRGGKDQRARWSPDGKKLAFLSSRDGTPQDLPIPLEGGEATQVTSLSGGADNELWSPDGKWIAFISGVYPDCKDDACNAQRDAATRKEQSESARLRKAALPALERVVGRQAQPSFCRRRQRRNAARPDAGRRLRRAAFQPGEPEAIAFSPDSQELCFTANTDKDEALSTNGDFSPCRSAARSAAEKHHDRIRRTIGAACIRPTENGSRTARRCSRDMKATAGG